MKKRRIRRYVGNLLLVILFVLGLALVFNNQIKNIVMKHNTERYAVSKATAETIQENQQKEETFDFDAVESASAQAVFQAQLNNRQLPLVGGVALPAVAINLPIFKGLSNEALLWGAGTMWPDQVMGEGNYSLASHRGADPGYLFEALDQTQVGDPIYLTDLTNIYVYQATLNITVDPTETQYIDPVPDKQLVTLITCNELGGSKRVVVQGELTGVIPVNEASDAELAAFNLEQKTY